MDQIASRPRGSAWRLPALLCCCVLVLSIIGLASALVVDMGRARRDFERAAISEGQRATVARIEAALAGGDRRALDKLLRDYRQSIRFEASQLDRSGERTAQAIEAARADRLLILASGPDGAARDRAFRRLVALISDGERVEAAGAAVRMDGLRRRTTFVAISLAALALLSALVGAFGLIAANRRLSGDVAARTRELATIERSRRLFFAKVSHELRTPVTVMRGEAEVALSEPAGSAGALREALDRVVANAEFLEHRIEELLSLARAEHGELTLDMLPIDLGRIVEAACQASSAYARALDVMLEHGPLGRPLRVRGDARWLQQALVAVLDNAIKFSPIGGIVVLTVGSDDTEAIVSIRDRGIGIPASALPRIFDAYYQTDDGANVAAPGSASRWRAGSSNGMAVRLAPTMRRKGDAS